jgi:hypothetical protein
MNNKPFEGTFPLWFVVAGEMVDVDGVNGRRRIRRTEPRACSFGVVGGQLSVLVFTDEELANRHARQVPGAVPFGVFSFRELADLLRPLHPTYFNSVVIDPQDKQCSRTKAQKTIPEFIACFQGPLRKP